MNIFKRKDKEMPIVVEITQYGVILGQTILLCSNDYDKFLENINREIDYFDYLMYLQYLLYISQELLKQKYEMSVIDKIIGLAINNIINSLEFIKNDSKAKVTNMIKEQYRLINNEKVNINTQEGIEKLANMFQEDLEIKADALVHINIVLQFTSFIKFHSSDILNDNLILKQSE